MEGGEVESEELVKVVGEGEKRGGLILAWFSQVGPQRSDSSFERSLLLASLPKLDVGIYEKSS